MKSKKNVEPVTPESVWALVRELAVKQEANERFLTERQAETDRLIKETGLQMKETDRQMKKVFQKMGSWDYNHGCFAEEYFFNSFENGKNNFFGENFDKIMKNKGGVETDDEYDILLINGQAVGIVETKFKAHVNDIPKVLKKANTFRLNFPKYENHKVYLGLASMAFYPKLEEECVKQGIAIIKQVGDSVIINDKHLKAF